MRVFGIVMFGAVGVAILLSLGIWQVQRLAWKKAILADIDRKIVATPVAIPSDANSDGHSLLPVTVTGTYTGATVRVLVSQKIYGAGYRLITTLETPQGRRVMIDRGFVSVNNPIPETPDTQIAVTGNLHWPQEVDGFTPDNDLGANIWFARTVPVLADHLGAEPVLVILRESTPNQPSVVPLPVDSAVIPNDHLNYALTWFSLALIWVGMTGYMLYRSRNTFDQKPTDT